MLFIFKSIKSILKMIDNERVFIPNIFRSNYPKKILISYITKPFFKGIDSCHSNSAEAVEIANILHKRQYQVDVVKYDADFNNIGFKNSYYDLIFGLEPNFLEAVQRFKPEKSIYYATGAHYVFQNKAEHDRLLDLQKRKGVWLKPKRYVAPHESSSVADAVICLGNAWTINTYLGKVKQIENIPVSAYSFFPLIDVQSMKEWDKARKNFLWFGSVGAVHKGLDLLLEIFSENPEIHLYVCGNVKKEKDFYGLYRNELLKTDNIHCIGWTDPDSVEFKNLAVKCAFTILPSCSEGMSGAVLTCMHAGLIPLVSRECGLDVEACGEIFEKNSIAEIKNMVINSSEQDISWLVEKSRKSHEYAQENNTIEKFSIGFNSALDKIL